jgi:hypothetical protein
MDSKKRHTHVAIGKADDQLASLMEYDDEASAEPDEEEESETPELDTAGIAQQLQGIYKTRLELEGMESVVVRDPEVMSGEPTFRGTRVLVRTLFDYLL